MGGYYAENLAGERLRRCYELAPPRVRQYLAAELDHVLARLTPGDRVLELGCGCGRVLPQLAERAGIVVGIDTSRASLALARSGADVTSPARPAPTNLALAEMNAAMLGFGTGSFDVVVCIQNGVSAFHVDRRRLVEEATRVTRAGGRTLFSSYAAAFWDDRLEWFRHQAAAGLLGEIDEVATGNGVIVCRDGFRATTVSPDEFAALAAAVGVPATVTEVDGSSVFCEMQPGR
jgi:2-polyprenyl-6-hydroxyphenyl methylase/3-demethylubiquinone-9 3-methyltransferase